MRQIELSYRRRTMRRAADCEPPAPTWGDLPGRHHILRLEQIEQVALGRKDVSIPRTNGGADIFRLAGLLGDDNLIRHRGLAFGVDFRERSQRTYSEPSGLRQVALWQVCVGRQNRGEPPPSDAAHCGGSVQVNATTCAVVSAASGALPGLRVLSRNRPSTPLSAKRCCHRHTVGRLTPMLCATRCAECRSDEGFYSLASFTLTSASRT